MMGKEDGGMAAAMPTIFVVDDDRSVREALARLLRSAGFEVQAFASAHEFLSGSRPGGPACLVLDVRLSRENGLALQENLQHQGWCLPIIFLTGHGTVPMCARALKAGAVDFLLKPCDDQALLEAVHTALEQYQHIWAIQRHRTELQQRVSTLTPRERDVLALVVTGQPNKQIADVLGTSEKTVKVHRARVMQKMRAPSLAALVRMADAVGLA
jgi:FixJ family two-component response regulator